jgi:hypothetical protein
MDSSSVSRFKRNTVYGLPTWEGLAMFSIVGFALWFSLTLRAPIEQWISFLMILLILVHLLESNPPYGSEDFLIPVQITNPSLSRSEPLQFRLDQTSGSKKDWTLIDRLAPKASQIIFLPHSAIAGGEHSGPKVRFQMRPASGLFRLWRVSAMKKNFLVMPTPVDHFISVPGITGDSSEPELSHLEFIHDPRLLPKMDQKLFQKTGKPFLRAHESDAEAAMLLLDWDLLSSLPATKRLEQFSAWLKNAEALRKKVSYRLTVQTPFYEIAESPSTIHFGNLKKAFAEWAMREA